MHLSVVYPITHTWGLYGGVVGDLRSKSHPRGGALSHLVQSVLKQLLCALILVLLYATNHCLLESGTSV